jgi:NAD(P)-dependent dehydrogenase (short-subunit alcohol dehydrogenase family)
MDLKLKAQTAFVSGSTAGIGYAIARRLLMEGAVVIINGRSAEGVDTAVRELQAEVPGARVSGIAADFSKSGEVNDLIAALPDEDWFRFFEVNVMSGVRLSRHCLPGMLKRNKGRIIFISSESAVFIPEEMIHYGMTKTAQLALGRGMAELTKGSKVTVNTILPGPTKSKGVSGFLEDISRTQNITTAQVEEGFFKNLRPTSLLQRFAAVEEVADTVAYYASPLASATNGAAIRVEGGLVRSIL